MRAMEKPVAPPADVLRQLERLQDATRPMPGLTSEIDFLQQRLERGDMSAAYVGIRTAAEALLRHATRVEELPRENGLAAFHNMTQALRARSKGRVDEGFWDHLGFIQGFGNRHAHFQTDDVYHAAVLRPADPWAEMSNCLSSLASAVSEFVRHWPPPPGFADSPLDEAASAKGSTETPRPPRSAPARGRAELGEFSARQALDDEAAREALESITGMTRGGITRRLNAVHGRTKIRNVFPDHFGSGRTTESPEDVALDYEAIGNLTITQARQLEVASDIARLTGSEDSAVKRKLNALNGNGVVRRQFPWYEAATIGELTARAALDYRLTPLLSRAFHTRAMVIEGKLREVPGQTKLRTIFPELDA